MHPLLLTYLIGLVVTMAYLMPWALLVKSNKIQLIANENEQANIIKAASVGMLAFVNTVLSIFWPLTLLWTIAGNIIRLFSSSEEE